MATITAEAKLYTGIRCWCVDKNISATLSSSFSVGNKNLPATDGSTIEPGVLVFRVKRNVISLEASRSLSLSTISFATKGGGNNVITAGSPRVINNTNNWKVKSSVVCKFPTYMRIDVEKLQLPEGTTCTVEFEEGWILEGDFPETTRAPSSKVPNFFTFRTPWYGLSFMNSSFSLPNKTGYRIKQLASSVNSASSIMARPVYNPGKLAAIEVSTFAVLPTINYVGSTGSTMQSAGTLGFVPLKIKQLASAVNSEFNFNLPEFDIVILFQSGLNSEFATLTNNGRVRFLQNQNINTATALSSNTTDSRIRNLSASANIVSAQSSITIKRTRPFTIQPINASASMSVTANKIGLIYTLTNPNQFDTPNFDFFGQAVAISNDYFAVSANAEDETGSTNSGRVYIYSKSSGTLVRTLVGSTYNNFGTVGGERFGTSMAMTNTNILVGAPYEDGPSTYTDTGRAYAINPATGAVNYIFSDATFTGSNNLGINVAISDSYFAVTTRTGITKLYSSSGTFIRNYTMDIGRDQSVAILGDYVVIGCPSSNLDVGQVKIFSASTGSLIRTIDNPSGLTTDSFGYAVSTDGTYVFIGAPYADDSGFTNVGKVYMYRISNGTLVKTIGAPTKFDYLQFGSSLAMTSSRLVIGSSLSGSTQGAFSIFDNLGNHFVTYTGSGISGGLGNSVAIYGDDIIVGEFYEPFSTYSASGKAYVYSLNKP